MDSIHFVKGYNKVENDLEYQAPKTHHTTKKSLFVTVAVSFILLFIPIGVFVHQSCTKSLEESPSLSSRSTHFIRTICNVTRYPDSCFSSLSALKPAELDPELIFMVSLNISFTHLSNLSSFPETLILHAKDPRSEAALRDCESLLEDASSQVNKTMLSMAVGPEEKMLTESKMEDMKTWLSSAITDQETCLDGLEEMNSSLLGEVKVAMQPSQEFTSNSLAILANINHLLQNFNLTMH